MSWCGRPEAETGCNGPRGPVADVEQIARLRGRPLPSGEIALFTRTDIFEPGTFSNACGDADGCSTDRVADLTTEQILELSEARAAAVNAGKVAQGKAPNRAADGARIASVAELRAYRWAKAPDDQAVFVYDDAGPANDRHAVVRASLKLSRVEQASVIADIDRLFAVDLRPPQAAAAPDAGPS